MIVWKQIIKKTISKIRILERYINFNFIIKEE